MNIDFELYRIFSAVASNKSITSAAKELNISQPAISKSIKKLETSLGGTLFTRTKKGVVLTEEGKEFYNYIKNAIEYINKAENKFKELKNIETGCIKIGISTTLTKEFLLPYLNKFHNLYPKIDIQIITNMSNELFTKLRNGLIDIIILNSNNSNYGKDIELIKCQKLQDCFITNNKILSKKTLSIKDLNNYPLILQLKGSNTRDFIDNLAKKYNTILKPNIELAGYSLVAEFTKIGFGIGYTTKEFILQDLKEEKLYEINLKEKIPNRYIMLGVSTNHTPNFCTKKLIELITKPK